MKLKWDRYPIVYEINTWVWLFDLSPDKDKIITLASVPDSELARIKDLGFNAIWLMGVWERSNGSREIASKDTTLIWEFENHLVDFKPEDVIGSAYAIKSYAVDSRIGGNSELIEFRQRLKDQGLLLVLDFVPNHFALDHAWLTDHPERFITGDSSKANDESYYKVGERIFAHGKPLGGKAWTDTAQLDYRKKETRQAMAKELISVAGLCDGVRCDMAMMVMHDVFLGLWGGAFDPRHSEFWPMAIEKAKSCYPDFLMVAEVHWGNGNVDKLHKQGFDYTFDRVLYQLMVDVVDGKDADIYAHLNKPLEYQSRMVRFTENHDENRASWIFDRDKKQIEEANRAATILALCLPGMKLIHEKQIEGYRYKPWVQLRCRRQEEANPLMKEFFHRLLPSLRDPVFRSGNWNLLHAQPASDGDSSFLKILAYQWTMEKEYRLIAVNLSPDESRCFLPLAMPWLAGSTWNLRDLLNDPQYRRDGNELYRKGLYLDMPRYGYHLFKLEKL